MEPKLPAHTGLMAPQAVNGQALEPYGELALGDAPLCYCVNPFNQFNLYDRCFLEKVGNLLTFCF